jgi:hypothetical protein
MERSAKGWMAMAAGMSRAAAAAWGRAAAGSSRTGARGARPRRRPAVPGAERLRSVPGPAPGGRAAAGDPVPAPV